MRQATNKDTHMKKQSKEADFIKQLSAIKRKFLKRASEYGAIDSESFEICICNGYLVLDVEVEDEYGDTLRCSQEVEQYSGLELSTLNFFVND